MVWNPKLAVGVATILWVPCLLKKRHIQKLANNKKIHSFCPILMEPCEDDHLIRLLFLPSFMRIQQKGVFLINGQFLNMSQFFPSTLHEIYWWNKIDIQPNAFYSKIILRCHFSIFFTRHPNMVMFWSHFCNRSPLLATNF